MQHPARWLTTSTLLLARFFAEHGRRTGGLPRRDGHWYDVGIVNDLKFYNGVAFYLPTAEITNCLRSDGIPQAYGTPLLLYRPTFAPVFQLTSLAYKPLPNVTGSDYLQLTRCLETSSTPARFRQP